MGTARSRTAAGRWCKSGKAAGQATNRGAAKLCKEADKALLKRGAKIAGSLADAATKGDIRSTKLLLELSGQQPSEAQEKPGTATSTAAELAAEPQWNGDAGAEPGKVHPEAGECTG